MDNIYTFLTSLCKDREIKIEELQKELGLSRTTLYRYMKGINHITPSLAKDFISALNMNDVEVYQFNEFISEASFDQTLVEARQVLDKFLFGNDKHFEKTEYENEEKMVFYNSDTYLRTISEIFDHIYSFVAKSGVKGSIKVVNCLNDDMFSVFVNFVKRVFSSGANIEIDQFISQAENDYLQNIRSFINVFPLIAYDKFKIYFREQDVSDALLNDTMLFSFTYNDSNEIVNQYFSLSFFEHGLAECIAFTDKYMYSYMAKGYANLKSSFVNVIQKCKSFGFEDDVFMEMNKSHNCCIIKPNPCHDKIPFEVYQAFSESMTNDQKYKFIRSMLGYDFDESFTDNYIEKALEYIKKRIELSGTHKQIDVYTYNGMIDLVSRKRINDQLDDLPDMYSNEVNSMISSLMKRQSDLKSDYNFYITKDNLVHKDLVIQASRDFGIIIEYVYPSEKLGLWNTLAVKSKRLGDIFCDYFENYIPINRAMKEDETTEFLISIMNK